MSILLILVPGAFALAGATGAATAGAAVGGAAVATGASMALGLATLGSTVAGLSLSILVKEGLNPGTVRYETHLNRRDLLENALRAIGCSVSAAGENLTAVFKGETLLFERGPDGAYHVIVEERWTEGQMTPLLESIYRGYTHEVQTSVYLRLKQQAQVHGFELEQETVHEDNAITLGFVVAGNHA